MNQQNTDFFDWDKIQEDNILPTGTYHVSVMLEDGMSGTGKRMPKARFDVKEPADYMGMALFENYVVGTDENPNNVNAGTIGARGLKKMLKAAQVPQGNSMAQLCASVAGSELLIVVNQYTEKDGAYAGTLRNRVANYHRLGEREVKVAPAIGSPPGMGAAPAMPAAPTPPPAAPVVNATPITEVPAAPTPPPVQASPAAPPVQPVVPAAPAAPGGPTTRCTICQQDVPWDQFGTHVQAHLAEGKTG